MEEICVAYESYHQLYSLYDVIYAKEKGFSTALSYKCARKRMFLNRANVHR